MNYIPLILIDRTYMCIHVDCSPIARMPCHVRQIPIPSMLACKLALRATTTAQAERQWAFEMVAAHITCGARPDHLQRAQLRRDWPTQAVVAQAQLPERAVQPPEARRDGPV